MLKLKKLQVLGFKSFCDRTELKFHGDGIACIVGPNGCGKSNVADAISWVLGEQSAKSLRGSRMEDVIFAGTRDRKPTGMAEVSLTLIDPEVYGGADASAEPEIEIQDEMPADTADDWDEAAERGAAAADTERYSRELQPGPEDAGASEDSHVEAGHVDAGDPTAESRGALPANPAGSEVTAGAPSSPSFGEGGNALPGAASPVGPAVVLRIRRRNFKTREHKAGEIMVTRRLFRTGESEYLLNGKLCRLRDIQDLFMGTGLGPESYAIIEQGRIGQILSSKPHDRRAIIEEAAGITKFKTRKRLAESRLEAARLNLARVNDIFEEVTRQMNSLKRQAAKAERYVRLRDEMRSRLRLVLASRFAEFTATRAALQCELSEIAGIIVEHNGRVQQQEAEHADAQQRGYALEADARQNAGSLSALALEADRATARRAHNEERCSELQARSAAAEAEAAQIATQLASLEGERDENRGVLASAASDVESARAQHELRLREAQQAAQALAELESEIERLRGEAMQAVAAASAVRNHLTQSAEHAAALERDAQRIRAELRGDEEQIAAFAPRRGQLALEFESASQRVAQVERHIAETRAALAQKREDERQSKMRLDTLRSEYATALGKKGSLEAVIAEHGYSTESVRRLFQSGIVERGFAPVGVLADFLEVDQQYEHVVEDFLRDELNYIVVKSWDAADQGLQLLRSDVDGRATFLVHPEDSQAKFSFLVDESTRHTPTRPAGGILPVTRCLRVLNGFGRSLEVILPKLRDGYMVPDNGVARELALESPEAFFLAPSGECFHNVTVTGGKQRSEGPLSMKRELREVLRQLAAMEGDLRSQEGRVALLAREIVELTTHLERLEQDKLESDKQALTTGHNLEQLQAEMGRAGERVHSFRAELDRVLAEKAGLEADAAARGAELSTLQQRSGELEQTMAAAQERLAGLRLERDAAAQTAGQMQARVAALEERRIAAAAALQRIETLAAEVAARVQSLRGQIEAAAAERQQRQQENVALAAQLTTLAAEREQAEAKARVLQAESESLRRRLVELEEEQRRVRSALDAARDRRGELAATLAKLESDTQHLAQSSVDELGTAPDQLLAEGTVPLHGEALATEDQAYREIRQRLDGMGPVNMMALEEYNETAGRHAFLEGQRNDLLESIANTQNTIKEIDTISRQKFEQAFERINENFQLTFRKLFGGGNAFMRLTDAENDSESGIDVVASPPGKKLQNVLLLSGGEKALTALALLVGIFQYQPSPFCILDEVDAPLDETNIGRFTELVREMARGTQFILITHSKKTMSIAPVMYGVTMQEPGVSKIVSVRFGVEQEAATA